MKKRAWFLLLFVFVFSACSVKTPREIPENPYQTFSDSYSLELGTNLADDDDPFTLVNLVNYNPSSFIGTFVDRESITAVVEHGENSPQNDMGIPKEPFGLDAYYFEVNRVLEGDFQPGDVLMVCIHPDMKGHYPDFQAGESYLLFVEYNAITKAYMQLDGARGIFYVTEDGFVYPSSANHTLRQLNGLTVDEFDKEVQKAIQTLGSDRDCLKNE